MQIGLTVEPFASMIGPASGSDGDPVFLPSSDSAKYWSGLDDDSLQALGLIAAYAGQLENWLWRLLRELAGGPTPATQVLTRDLPVNRITQYIRELAATDQWRDFSRRFLVVELAGAVDEAMRQRNRVVHGGLNGSVVDDSLLGYTVRKRKLAHSEGMDDDALDRAELPALATRLFELQAIAMTVWLEAAMVVVHDPPTAAARPWGAFRE